MTAPRIDLAGSRAKSPATPFFAIGQVLRRRDKLSHSLRSGGDANRIRKGPLPNKGDQTFPWQQVELASLTPPGSALLSWYSERGCVAWRLAWIRWREVVPPEHACRILRRMTGG